MTCGGTGFISISASSSGPPEGEFCSGCESCEPKDVQTHDLKTWPEYFQAVESGAKPFEVRKDDRGFKVGHTLILREFDPATGRYTGRSVRRRVSYLLWNYPALHAGYVVIGLAVEVPA